MIIGNGEPSVYRENYTQYLFYSSFYKKFVFTEFTYSKEGDFKNEEIIDEYGKIDSIKLISTIFTGRTSFLLPFKKYQLFLNGKIFYYSHPLLDVYKKYYSKDSIVYKFKKYAFCTDIGIGINLNENIYLFSLIENILKTKKFYVSIDLDVLDPAFFPAVTNPEPGGIDFKEILNTIIFLSNFKENIIGFDVVEYNPLVSQEITWAISASIIIREIICSLI
ncbi:MAG: arginase family protein [candidate division WOR-3 bacterium]